MPERTCVGCGNKSEKVNFLRFTYSYDRLVLFDIEQKIQSRGVYFCLNKKCLMKGLKKHVFHRFFRDNNIDIDFNELVCTIYTAAVSKFYSVLILAQKLGKVIECHGGDVAKNGYIKLLLAVNNAKFLENMDNLDFVEIFQPFNSINDIKIKRNNVFAIRDEGIAKILERSYQICAEVKFW